MNIAGLTKGKYMASTWKEFRNGTTKKNDNKTGDDIARDVIKKAGLTFMTA